MFLSILIALLCVSTYIRSVQCNPVPGTGNGDYAEKNPETLGELLNPQDAIIQGDMMMPSDRNALEAVWPGAQGRVSVPYFISPLIVNMTDIMLKAIEMVSKHTCVSFHQRTIEPDYLFFQPSKGCASFVGFRGGIQKLFVGPGCSAGNVAHEILHALGFHHEHTRMDRNQHIRIIENNIMEGSMGNFLKKPGNTFNLPYDSSSIMHYGSLFFSKNGLPTIMANKDDDQMGQRTHLTPLDIKRVRVLYKCVEEVDDETTPPVLTSSMKAFLAKFNRLKELHLLEPVAPGNVNRNLPSVHSNAVRRMSG